MTKTGWNSRTSMHAKSKCYFFIHIYIYIFNTENVPHLKCTLKNNYPYVSIQPRLQGKSIKYTSTVTLNLNGFFFWFFFWQTSKPQQWSRFQSLLRHTYDARSTGHLVVGHSKWQLIISWNKRLGANNTKQGCNRACNEPAFVRIKKKNHSSLHRNPSFPIMVTISNNKSTQRIPTNSVEIILLSPIIEKYTNRCIETKN